MNEGLFPHNECDFLAISRAESMVTVLRPRGVRVGVYPGSGAEQGIPLSSSGSDNDDGDDDNEEEEADNETEDGEDEIDPKDLKVVELREELKKRGLVTEGLKGALVARLTMALKGEGGASIGGEGSSEGRPIRRPPNDTEIALVGKRYNDERSGKLYEVVAVRWSWKYTCRSVGFPGMIVAYRQLVEIGVARSRGDLEGFSLEYTRAQLDAAERKTAAAAAKAAAEASEAAQQVNCS